MKPRKKSKQYTLGSGGLPKSLVDRLYYIPEYFDPEKHPLSPYLKKQIIPEPGLDILLLQDYKNYCYKVNLPGDIVGLYIAIPHCYTPPTDIKQDMNLLREDYGITTSRAAIFPDSKIMYSVFIHELLHDAFNNLNDASREELLDSASPDFKKLRQIPPNVLFHFLPFAGVTRTNLWLFDEFIAYFFTYNTDNLITSPFSSENSSLPKKFRKTMRHIGYKV